MNSTSCKYYTERTLGWMLNNKLIVFLSLLSFCLFVSTLAMAGQRNRLAAEVDYLKTSTVGPPTTSQATTTVAPNSATTTTVQPVQETTPTQAPSQDTTPTQAPSQDTTPTQAPSQDTTPTQAPSQDTTPTQAPSQDTTPTQAPSQDTTPTQAPSQDTTPTQAPSQETTPSPAPSPEPEEESNRILYSDISSLDEEIGIPTEIPNEIVEVEVQPDLILGDENKSILMKLMKDVAESGVIA